MIEANGRSVGGARRAGPEVRSASPRGQRRPLGVAFGMIVIEIRADASPKSAVLTKAVPRPLPSVAPAGIVVAKTAAPDSSVTSSPVRAVTPGIVSVKVTVSPTMGLPSGSVTWARSWMFRGSFAALSR